MTTKDQQRIEELEGLLASTTRQLEARTSDLRDAEEELEQAERIAARVQNLEVDLGQGTAHLAAIDRALERLALWIAETDTDDGLWDHTEQSEPYLNAAASAILTLATARDKIAAKPTPKPTLPAVR